MFTRIVVSSSFDEFKWLLKEGITNYRFYGNIWVWEGRGLVVKGEGELQERAGLIENIVSLFIFQLNLRTDPPLYTFPYVLLSFKMKIVHFTLPLFDVNFCLLFF